MAQSKFRSLLSVCVKLEKPVFIIPAAEEWLRSAGSNRIRMLTADDVVGRPNDELDLAGAAERIANHTVLVTGAAGSIGSELCRILVTLKPKRLGLVDNNESGLFHRAGRPRGDSKLGPPEALASLERRPKSA